MSTVTTPEVVYEDSDGEPISDNTLQFRWIVTLQGGLDALFHTNPDVFVAGDLLWYPVEGRPDLRAAPDVLVAFGRPKGDRGSYRQWVEGGIAPQVVFEVLSPGNRAGEMAKKLLFYEAHGVEEYYVYDPDRVTLAGYLRDRAGQFDEVPVMDGHVSPRLGIRFELADELIVSSPGGGRFLTYLESIRQFESERAEAERERAEAASERAKAESERAEAASERAKAESERAKAAAAEAKVEALRAKLRAAGIDPDAV